MRTRFWGGVGWAFLILVAACNISRANDKDDGTRCTSDDDCDSKKCNINFNRCEGSECDTDHDCNDGWTCAKGEEAFIGRAPDRCASTCSGCPVGYSCKPGGTECDQQNPIEIAIEQPAAGTILQRGKPVTAHAKVGTSVDPEFITWKLDTNFAANDNDAAVTPSQIGTVKLVVEVSTVAPGAHPRGTAEATYQVCEPEAGVGCNAEADCCAPLKCSDTGFGKKSCVR